ncbi:hypothetical protein P389DRAFT_92570 [Cystobasidium minutum MCA 4210]|uniref:uncharacterized protein n=1 Tax=Cystobasidium minutum MCA 4210 TaxID=1397322 RepID=UPI0034CF4193|eukprot:jgi/Rhomi1/92570/CE92569_181
MTVLQPSSLLTPHLARALPANAHLASLLQQLGVALSDPGVDDYERAYAQTWLTRLFTTCGDDDILDRAAELLSMTNSAAEKQTNRNKEPYCFDSPKGQIRINIEEGFMQDVHATGFQTWSSAVYLARRMLADPRQFFKAGGNSTTAKPRRILELGSGTGLGGIAAYHALLQATDEAHLVLSDMDQPTLDTLTDNVRNNSDQGTLANIHVEVCHLDWTCIDSSRFKPFDTILGADLVYEPEHADLLHNVVQKLLAKSSSSIFHLVVVMRRTHGKDIAALESRFRDTSADEQPVLVIRNREDLEADEEDQQQYRYYQIGWKNLLNS